MKCFLIIIFLIFRQIRVQLHSSATGRNLCQPHHRKSRSSRFTSRNRARTRSRKLSGQPNEFELGWPSSKIHGFFGESQWQSSLSRGFSETSFDPTRNCDPTRLRLGHAFGLFKRVFRIGCWGRRSRGGLGRFIRLFTSNKVLFRGCFALLQIQLVKVQTILLQQSATN